MVQEAEFSLTKWKKPRRSTAYKVTEKGALYLEFQAFSITAVRPLPCRIWQKSSNGKGWCSIRYPVIDFAALVREVEDEDAVIAGKEPATKLKMQPFFRRRRKNFRKLLADLPPETPSIIRDITDEPWPVIQLLVSSPRARELAASSHVNVVHALTYAREVLDPRPRRPLEFARRWLKKSPRHALARLGFPDRPATVRIMQKMPRPSSTR